MNIHIFQKGFNYAQDGQGNRLVYHLQGCNLACPWCSNPEGMSFDGGNTVSVSDIVDEAVRCRPMFFDGGGVTFTGGECTCQFEPLSEALLCLRQQGISTAIETNATAPNLPALFGLVDELIMDLKHDSNEIHRRVIGMGNTQILDNLRAACAVHPNVLVRIPLIGGFNASVENIQRFAELLETLPTDSVRIELLLYHEYGKEKWKKCGKAYTVKNAFVSEQERCAYEEILRSHGLRVVRT